MDASPRAGGRHPRLVLVRKAATMAPDIIIESTPEPRILVVETPTPRSTRT
eukprot:COSAG01_NODE_8200_length_2878_cov_3.534005_1_plen_50_part_10